MSLLSDLMTLAGICFFLYLYNYFRNKFSATKLPPGPLGFPFVGILPFLGKYPERQFAKWSKKYGPIITVKIGLKNYVVLNNYDVIQKVISLLIYCYHYRTQTFCV